MEIKSARKENMKDYNIDTKCNVYTIHVKITDINSQAKEIIQNIRDTSWIESLDEYDKVAYNARAERTINKLVNDILTKVNNKITEEFGEILVSNSARLSLNTSYDHIVLPLAELWKEKLTGNPGFDFHTETKENIICFGEAKYSGSKNPHTIALEQINSFITEKKDCMEFSDIRRFASESAMKNAIDNKKAYVAAFSINSGNTKLIFSNALQSDYLNTLLIYPELYLIGVEV